MRREDLSKSNQKEASATKGVTIRLATDFFTATMEVRRQWNNTLTKLRGKNAQNLEFYTTNLLFEGRIKTF